MAAKKYLAMVAGFLTEVAGIVTSAGAADDGKIPALDSTGRLDTSMMPAGIGAETKTIQASEALAAGDLVNVYNSSGAKCRKADATTAGKQAHGFVLAVVNQNANATVYFSGINNQCTGLTPGDAFLSTSAGLSTGTAPTGSGNVVQRVGVAISTTELDFKPMDPVTLA